MLQSDAGRASAAAAIGAAAAAATSTARPLVGVIMGSDSDLPTMKAAADILEKFDVPYELTIVSAHRTPVRMTAYATVRDGKVEGVAARGWMRASQVDKRQDE